MSTLIKNIFTKALPKFYRIYFFNFEYIEASSGIKFSFLMYKTVIEVVVIEV